MNSPHARAYHDFIIKNVWTTHLYGLLLYTVRCAVA